MKLIIAEKPSVGRSIAEVVGATSRKDGYLEGNGYLVSWCFGHLIGLSGADVYDEKYKHWVYEDLPILPNPWKFEVKKDTAGKQYYLLKKLMERKDVTSLVCATDAGREGELIFRLVYHVARCKKPVQRLWISSMEETAIKDGLQKMKDGTYYDNLYYSADARAKADWLVGMNMSRLFSIFYQERLPIGRVQTPTLGLIVTRYEQIQHFQKEKYYVIHLDVNGIDAVSNRIMEESDAKKIAELCNGASCVVESMEEQEKRIKSPKLFDLTTLQREANRVFSYTAQKTLNITQALYEKKLVTYPRTDSQYLTEDMEDSTVQLIQELKEVVPFVKDILIKPDVKKVLNSSKVSDHHAIIPTMEVINADLSELELEEQNILYLIAGKLFMATATDHIDKAYRYAFVCKEYHFFATGKSVLQAGFYEIANHMKHFFNLKVEEKENHVVEVGNGEIFENCKTRIAESYTQPPKYYTEDTLLSAMERAGNEFLEENTEKKGMGTPATRADMIEKLISTKFVERKEKFLIPTEKGISLIKVIPEELKSPKMTADWEMKLTHIAQGKESADCFLKEITDFMQKLIERYQPVNDEQENPFGKDKEKEVFGICPHCGSKIYEREKGYCCSKRDCKFALWKKNYFLESQGKRMTEANAKAFLEKGKIYFKDLVSKKTGKKYAATFVMTVADDGKVDFLLEFPKKSKKGSQQ